MRTQPRIEPLLDVWLAEGPTEIGDRVVASALDLIEHTGQRRVFSVPRWWSGRATPVRYAAASALLLVVVLAGGLVIGSWPSVGTAPSPTPISSVTPSASGSPQRSIGFAPLPTAYGGATQLDGRPTVAGVTYYTEAFSPAFTLRPGAGWWLTNASGTLISIEIGPNEPSPPAQYRVQLMQPTRVVPPGNSQPIAAPADLIGWLRSRPDLQLSTPAALTIGGIQGTLVEGALRPGAAVNPQGIVNLVCSADSICGYQGGMLVAIAPDRHVTFVVVDVRGIRILISLGGPLANSAADQAVLAAVLNSLTFPLPSAR